MRSIDCLATLDAIILQPVLESTGTSKVTHVFLSFASWACFSIHKSLPILMFARRRPESCYRVPRTRGKALAIADLSQYGHAGRCRVSWVWSTYCSYPSILLASSQTGSIGSGREKHTSPRTTGQGLQVQSSHSWRMKRRETADLLCQSVCFRVKMYQAISLYIYLSTKYS